MGVSPHYRTAECREAPPYYACPPPDVSYLVSSPNFLGVSTQSGYPPADADLSVLLLATVWISQLVTSLAGKIRKFYHRDNWLVAAKRS